jgi:dTDP-glucose 4,6-dehydratase
MQKREWIHVSDHCKGIAIAIAFGERGEIYNIGSGRELTNISLAMLILSAVGKESSQIQYVEDRKGHDFRYAVNFEKIENIGFKPEIKFEDGLMETIDWYKKKLSANDEL